MGRGTGWGWVTRWVGRCPGGGTVQGWGVSEGWGCSVGGGLFGEGVPYFDFFGEECQCH